MSKVSAMQAMREARYAAARTPRPAGPAPTVPPVRQAAPAGALDDERPAVSGLEERAVAPAILAPATIAPAADDVATVEEALCGHRSMNNRSCRRPAGHPEKNHRYN